MSKYDNVFKSEVINSGLVHEVKVKHKDLMYGISKKLAYDEENGVCTDVSVFKGFNENLVQFKEFVNSSDKLNCAWLYVNSERQKNKRLYSKTKKVVESNQGWFITLTFTDKILSSTSMDTRRRYVSRFFKQHFKFYVANIDFGSLKGREHYHGVAIPKSDLNCVNWPYGFFKFEKITTYTDGSVDYIKLGRYITKLFRHAIKTHLITTRLIYSRMSDKI